MGKHKNYITHNYFYSIISGLVTQENNLPIFSALIFIGITAVVISQTLSLTVIVTQKLVTWLTPVTDQVNLTVPTIVTKSIQAEGLEDPTLTNILALEPEITPNYSVTNVFYLQHPPEYLTLSFILNHPFISFIDLSMLFLGSLIIAYGLTTIYGIFKKFF